MLADASGNCIRHKNSSSEAFFASLLLFFVVCPLPGVVTSGEGLFPGVGGRNPIATSGEDPLIGEAGRNPVVNSGEDLLTGVDD
ncbi:MAG: hypothetical protein WCB13_00295 [Trichococcus sp.]